MERQYTVYCHTNKVNGKKYIGVTSNSVHKRWNYGNGYSGQYFHRAIAKYGWDGFEHEVLYDGLTAEYAGEMEQYLIAKYRTNDRRYGYNICGGGVTRYEITDEMRQRLRDSHAGQKMSEKRREMNSTLFGGVAKSAEHRAKIGDGIRKAKQQNSKSNNTTFRHWKTDKRLSEEHKKHISESGKGKHLGKENPMAKAVVCVETGQRFDTIKQASEWIGVTASAVKNVLRQKAKTAGGYRWEYADTNTDPN